MDNTPLAVFWFRRDLRLEDNAGLYQALRSGYKVLPLFIFDTDILDKLEDKADKRVQFIHNEISQLHAQLQEHGSSLLVQHGKPIEVWKKLIKQYWIQAVYTNHDYESYGNKRDQQVAELLMESGSSFATFKDVVVFEKDEVTKDDGLPYTVFTPYSRKWKAALETHGAKSFPSLKQASNFFPCKPFNIPTLKSIGFQKVEFDFPPKVIKANIISNYAEKRDFPALPGTSHLGIHLRFGTLSVRKLLAYAMEKSAVFVNELIWRDFYHQVLYHFPHVEKGAFRKEYDKIPWVNNEAHFQAWCEGKTGFPLVDAGMRELNTTGFMHNRIRMLTASFLTKNLLVDWRWGEAYFAEKLLDFDLAANNGGWQWAAGCGTDAAPYFRVFSPSAQLERFDPQMLYIKKWVPEFGTKDYHPPIVDFNVTRQRAINVYKKALTKDS